MTIALIALGANLGDRQANLDQALQLLAARPGVQLVAASRSHATHPVGGPSGQSDFLNAAAIVETSLDPVALFAALREIETALGRHRDGPRWSPRSIDLDLLLFGSQIIDSADLTVPHPRMAFRRFVIEPAAEVAPSMVHPTIGWTLAELRDHLRNAPPYVAIAGAPGGGKSQLAAEVSRLLGATLLTDPAAQQSMQSSPTDASGPTWESEIELLNLRSAQLAATILAGKEQRKTVISDYWFDQALCFATMALSCGAIGGIRPALAIGRGDGAACEAGRGARCTGRLALGTSFRRAARAVAGFRIVFSVAAFDRRSSRGAGPRAAIAFG